MNNMEKPTGGEKPAGKGELNSLGTLAEMGDKFNPDKARLLAEQDKPKESKEVSTDLDALSKKSEQKPVEELTPEEASKEYLDLLLDLSANFTSAEGKSSRAAEYDAEGNLHVYNNGYSGKSDRIVGQLYETATGKNFRDEERKSNYRDGWEDNYIDRELTLGMADDIIAAESSWRAAGESTTPEAEQAEKAVLEQERAEAKSKLDKIEHGIFGKLKKAFYVNFRNKKYNQIYSLANREPQTAAEQYTEWANAKLQSALEAAYSEDYGYGHHKLSYAHTSRDNTYTDKINSEYNDKFFSQDRQAKIDRAVELRRKLRAEEIIKK